jgi:hypothetical protein
LLYAAIGLAWEAVYVAFDRSYVSHHPVSTACWDAFGLAILAALVVWRQRWAWWLVLIGQVWSLLYLLLGATFHPVWAGAELVLLALLFSRPTRRYLFPDGRPVREVRLRRDWAAPLILSGLLTLLLAAPARHRAVENVGARIAGWVVFWLLLAAALHVIARHWPKKAMSRRAAWAASLLLGGTLTVLIGVSLHHHATDSVGARVMTWIIVWLLLTAVFRVSAWILQTAVRLTQRGQDPPTADPGS